MADRLLVKLIAGDSERLQVASIDKQGHASGATSIIAFEELAQLGKRQDFVLVMPGENVLLREATLPQGRSVNANNVVPWILEDELVEDIDKLHFVTVKKDRNNTAGVAISRAEVIQQLLKPFMEHNLFPRLVSPEPLLLPLEPDGWSVMEQHGQVVFRNGEYDGGMASSELFEIVAARLLEQTDHDHLKSIRVWETEGSDRISRFFKLHGYDVSRQDVSVNGLLDIAELSKSAYKVNLLNHLQVEGQTGGNSKNYLVAAIVILCLALAVWLVEHAIEYQKLKKKQSEIAAASEIMFRKAFPQVKRVVDPVAQATQLLKKRQGLAGVDQKGFLSLMYDFGEELKNNRKLKLTSVQYRKDQLSIRLTADSIASVEALKNNLRKKKTLQVEIVSTTTQDKTIDVRLRVRRMP